ncbi:MAG: hypothetical protein HKO64_01975 [Xanthomonadales bacterium]|nr:hypothetical protein [Xanthomonadales bacterium]NNL94369.1 hypothetical protein [Xanthomonadales bacterium]
MARQKPPQSANQGWRSQTLELERGYSKDTAEILTTMGHDIRFEQTMGSTQSLMQLDGKYYGAADSRRPSALAAGVIGPPRPREVRKTGTDG